MPYSTPETPAPTGLLPVDPLEPKTEEQQKYEDEKKVLFDVNLARGKIDALITHFAQIKQKTITRRDIRNVEIDVEALQQTGELKDDQTIISIRTCDTNIEKEKPPFIRFIKETRRAAIFTTKTNPKDDNTLIEKEFTDKMRYSGWELPFYEVLDGAQTHAWACIKIEYSRTKPGGVNLVGIEHDKLMFWTDLENIQASDEVLMEHDLTKEKLREFVKEFGFTSSIVEELIGKHCSGKQASETIKVYERYFRCEGFVYVSWYQPQATGWIKEPALFSRGKKKQTQVMEMVTVNEPLPSLDGTVEMIPMQRPVPKMVWEPENETLYPFRMFIYRRTEQKKISSCKGRIFLDFPKQEAQTALWSCFINGAVRATQVYASPKNATGDRLGIVSDLELEGDKLYTNALEFSHKPYPSADILKAASQLDSTTQSEVGQVAYAATNREDSRKTAEEIKSANQQSSLLDSVDVSLWAIFVREVMQDAWPVMQSLALQGVIVFLPTTNELGMPSNDLEKISKDYELKAAGEVDVVEKAERRQKRQIMWGLISQTPLALEFLVDIIKEEFPEDAERYEEILRAGDAKGAMLTQVLNVLKQVMFDEQGKLLPEFVSYAPQLGKLAQQNIQILGEATENAA